MKIPVAPNRIQFESGPVVCRVYHPFFFDPHQIGSLPITTVLEHRRQPPRCANVDATMEPPRDEEFPAMSRARGRSQSLEGTASTVWSLLFFAYSSSTFVSEFPNGWPALWTVLFVLAPVLLTGAANILDKRPKAVPLLLLYVLYVVVPSLVQLSKPPSDGKSTTSHLFDFATVILIWLPLELKLLSKDFSPTGKVTVWALLTAALNIVNIFTVLNPFPQSSSLGYSYKLSIFDTATALAFSVVCIMAVLPLAVALSFGKFRSNFFTLKQRAPQEVAVFFGMYISAVTEELLFRGLIHNMIRQRSNDNSFIPLSSSSVLYAIAHVSKSKLGFKAPNYRFAAIALFSAAFYGMVWHITGKVTASALTHAIVDFAMYRMFLSEPLTA